MAFATSTSFGSMQSGGDVSTLFARLLRKPLAMLSAIAIVFAAVLVAAPMAGATGATISNISGSANVSTTTSLDAEAFLSMSSAWGAMSAPSVTLYAYDRAQMNGQPQPPSPMPSGLPSCVASFSGAATWASLASMPSWVHCTITGLTTGHLYYIYAVAADGGTQVSNGVSMGYFGVGARPDAATDITVTPGHGQATVSFKVHGMGDGTFQSGYVNMSGAGFASCTASYFGVTNPADGTVMSCTMYGLSALSANAYQISVMVFTSISDSTATLNSTPAIPAPGLPGTPSVVAAVPSVNNGSGAMQVYLDFGSDIGGTAIRSWTCTAHDLTDLSAADVTASGRASSSNPNTNGACGFNANDMPNTSYWNFTTNSGSTWTLPAAPLVIGHTYYFTVTDTNATGDSPASTSQSITQKLMGNPNAVTNIVTAQGTGNQGGLKVSWTAAQANGTPVTSYDVTASPEATIGSTCGAPNSAMVVQATHDAQDNLFAVTSVYAAGSYSYSLVYCKPDGTAKTISFSDKVGGLAAPSISGTTATFYAPTLVSNVWGVDRYTFTTTDASPTLSRTRIFATAGSSDFGRTFAANATKTVFYSLANICSMGCSTQVLRFDSATGTNATPPVVTAKIVANYPSTGMSSPRPYGLAIDADGAAWVSTGVSSFGQSMTFGSGHLFKFSAATLGSIGQSAPTPDADYSVDPALGIYTMLGTGPSGFILGSTVASQGMSGTTGVSVRKINTATGDTVSLAGVGGPDGYRAPSSTLDLSYDANGNVVAGYMSGGMAGTTLPAYVIPVASQPPGGTCTGALESGSTWSCTITGLFSNLYYAISVIAHVSYTAWQVQYGPTGPTYSQAALNGGSQALATATVYALAPNIPPPAVTGVTATQGADGVAVSWTPGSSPTKPSASSYTASAYAGSSTTAAGSCTVSAPATTCTITGLAAGTYSIKVGAKNTYTDSHTSEIPVTAASGTITVTTPPGSVTAITATAIANGATVSWTAPTNLGGATANSLTYVVTAIPAGQGSAGTCTWTSGTTATCSGLSTSDTYTFRVVASNTAGAGPSATSSAPITPLAPPGKPNAPTLTVGSGGLLVKGSSTLTTGLASGSQTLTYTATVKNPQSVAVGSCTYTDAAAGCAVTGLVNGTVYTVTVTATNSAGITGSASDAATGTPAGAPGTPTSLAVTVPSNTSGGAANLTWSAPSFTGGDGVAITGYDITASPSGSCSVTTTDLSSSSLAGTCTGLTNGTSYTFSVIAKNGSGDNIQTSDGSNAVTATVASLPGAPTGVQGTGGDVSVAVKWTAPTNTGGTGVAITGYTVQALLNGDTLQGKTCTTTGATGCTVFGLTNGTSYTFTVTATNLIGTGSASTASGSIAAVTPPSSAPAAPTISSAALSSDKKSITLTFNGGTALCAAGSKCATGGKTYPVTGYIVTSQPAGATCTTKSAVTATTQSYTCTGVAGQAYTFKVAATNRPASGTVPSNIGQGSHSSATTSLTPQGAPVTPTNVSISALNGNMTVSFNFNTSDSLQTGGSTITAFTVTATDPTAAVPNATCTPASLTGTSFSCQMTGLGTETAYDVTVTATNALGTSAAAKTTGITPALNFQSLTAVGTVAFAIAVGGNGQISRSLNGGTTWAPSPDSAPTLSNLNGVSCTRYACVAVGDGGTILVLGVKTTTNVHATAAPTYASATKSVTVKAANSLVVGQRVWIDGASGTQFQVTAASPTQFTVIGSGTAIAADPKWSTSTNFDWLTTGPQAWTAVPVNGVTENLGAVSCAAYDTTGTTVACFIGGANGRLLAMNWSAASPNTLTQASITGATYDATAAVNAISCSAASNSCMVAGGNGQLGVLTRPSTISGSPSLAMLSVSALAGKSINSARCVATTAGDYYCVGVGQGGLIVTDGKLTKPAVSTAGNWQVLTGPQSQYDLNGVSCRSSNICVAVGDHGTIEVSQTTGTTLAGNTSASWQTIPSGLTYDLNSVRCMASGCVAAGVGHIVIITPPPSGSTTWKVRPIG